MGKKVTLIPGDGIGPETTAAACRVLDSAVPNIEWIEACPKGIPTYRMAEHQIEDLLESIRDTKVALKGPSESPPPEYGKKSLHVTVRQRLDLFANVRPAKTLDGVHGSVPGVDLIIVRENTEDAYSGLEVIDELGARAEATKVITRHASERIVRFAFAHAISEGRSKVTAVHKADLLKKSDGLFASTARRVALDHPKIEFEERYVDNIPVELIRRPRSQDVMVLPNQYGDIISGLAAGLIGGLGMAPGMNIGDDVAVFEPTHGIASRHAGKDRANPTATILSGVLMLRDLGFDQEASRIEAAVAEVIAKGDSVTYDLLPEGELGESVSTTKMTDTIIDHIDAAGSAAYIGLPRHKYA